MVCVEHYSLAERNAQKKITYQWKDNHSVQLTVHKKQQATATRAKTVKLCSKQALSLGRRKKTTFLRTYNCESLLFPDKPPLCYISSPNKRQHRGLKQHQPSKWSARMAVVWKKWVRLARPFKGQQQVLQIRDQEMRNSILEPEKKPNQNKKQNSRTDLNNKIIILLKRSTTEFLQIKH